MRYFFGLLVTFGNLLVDLAQHDWDSAVGWLAAHLYCWAWTFARAEQHENTLRENNDGSECDND